MFPRVRVLLFPSTWRVLFAFRSDTNWGMPQIPPPCAGGGIELLANTDLRELGHVPVFFVETELYFYCSVTDPPPAVAIINSHSGIVLITGHS
ncbi:hypothetical protein FKM82_026675 [Ascaphus truei]